MRSRIYGPQIDPLRASSLPGGRFLRGRRKLPASGREQSPAPTIAAAHLRSKTPA